MKHEGNEYDGALGKSQQMIVKRKEKALEEHRVIVNKALIYLIVVIGSSILTITALLWVYKSIRSESY